MINGNMAFHAGNSKNISFHVSKGAGIYFGDTDIESIPNKTQLESLYDKYKSTLDAVFQIRRNVLNNQMTTTGVKTKLLRLEGAIKNLTTTTNNITISNNNKHKQMRKLSKMLSILQANLHELLQVLKTDKCINKPCKNGGRCFNTYIGYHCLCPDTWTGTNCELDIDECKIYKGTPKGCQNEGKCVNKENGFYCECKPPYHGELCQSQINSCEGDPEICGQHGHCVNLKSPKTLNGINYMCLCPYGYKNHDDPNNPYCEDINECLQNPCYPGATCINTPGSFECTGCPKGTQGNGALCIDIDECLDERLNDCSKDPPVRCINTQGSYQCDVCPAGYEGDGKVCKKLGICSKHTCPSDATCVEAPDTTLGYICQCLDGSLSSIDFKGTCEHSEENPCKISTCKNGGTCYARGWYSISCICPFGYGGDKCQFPTNCLDSHCNNRGNCITDNEDGVCDCYLGYYGSECQYEDTFLGCNLEISNKTGSLDLRQLMFFDEKIGVDYCTWRVKIPGNNLVSVLQIQTLLPNETASSYEDERYECDINESSIIIKDGQTKNAPIIANFCKGPTHDLIPIINREVILSGSNFIIEFTPLLKHSTAQFLIDWHTQPKKCGGILKNSFGEINFKQKKEMTHCSWYIEVHPDHHIQIEIDRVSMITRERVNCTVNSLQIYDGNVITTNKKVNEVCSNENGQISISTSGPYATVYWSNDNKKDIYNSKDCISEEECNFGFRLTYKITELPTDCGGELYPNEFGMFEGTIQSPNYPNNFFQNLDCLWILNSTGAAMSHLADHVIKVDFIDFDIPSKKDEMYCESNSLQLKPSSSKQYEYIFCNNDKPYNSYTYNGEGLEIKFHSETMNNGRGFLLSYKSSCEKHFFTENGTIKSVNYPDPSSHPINCTYVIYAPPTKGIKLKIKGFELEQEPSICYGPPNDDIKDYVKFSGPHSSNKMFNKKHICKRHPFIPPNGDIITSATRPLVINYVSSGSPKNKGFLFEYETFELGCGGIFNEPNGTISSPNFPDGYLENIFCVYEINVESEKLIRITFDRFDIEASSNEKDHCNNDVVSIYENYITEAEHGELIGEFCGSILPPSIVSKSNKLTIVLRTDRSVKGVGFNLTYESIDNDSNCDQLFTEPSGVIEYNGTANPNWVVCNYHIRLPRNKKILIKFDNYTIPCLDASLHLRNGLGMDSPGFKGLYGKSELCSGHPITSLRTHGNFFYMKLFTGVPSKTSFKISYEQYDGGCGGKLSGYAGAISTPHYPEKDKHSYDCEWHVVASLGNQIQFHIIAMDDLSLPYTNSTNYCHGYMSNSIDVYEGYSKGYEKLISYCIKAEEATDVKTKGNDMIIKYKQNQYGTKESTFGFLAEYKTHCTGILLDDFSGYIQNPGYGHDIYDHVSCNWRIDVGKGNRIRVTIVEFEVFDNVMYQESNNKNCNDNWLKVGDRQIKTMENRKEIISNSTFNDFCSSTNPIHNFETVGNILDISYNTYRMPKNKFWIYYETIGCGGTVNENNTIISISNDTSLNIFSQTVKPEFECKWKIIAPYGFNVRVNVEKLLINRVEAEMDGECINGLTYFSGLSNITGVAQRRHCSKIFDNTYTSHTNELFITLVAKEGTYSFDKKDNTMFKTTISFVPSNMDEDCGGEIKLKLGDVIPFHTVNYPKPYVKGILCKWKISSPPGYSIGYRLKTFNGGRMGTFKVPKFNKLIQYKYKLVECSDTNLRIFGFLFVKVFNPIANDYESLLTTCGEANIKEPIFINTNHNDSIVEFRGTSLDFASASNELINEPIGLLMEAFPVCGGDITATKERKTYNFNSIHDSNCTIVIMPEEREGEVDTIKVKLTSIWLGKDNDTRNDKPTIFNFTCSTDQNTEPWSVTRANYENRWYSFSCQGPIIVEIFNATKESIHNMILQYGAVSHFCGGEITGNGLEEADSRNRDFECTYTYSNALGSNVEIQIENVSIPWSENCIDGYFEVRKNNESGDVLGRFCGQNNDVELNSRGIGQSFEANKLWMRYKVKMENMDGSENDIYSSIKFNKHAKIGGFVDGRVIESPKFMVPNEVYTWKIIEEGVKGIALKIESLNIPNEDNNDIIECKSSKLCEGLTIMAGICENDQDWETCGRVLHNFYGFIADDREINLGGKEFTIGVFAKTNASFKLSWVPLYATNELINHTTIETDTDFNCGGYLNPSFEKQILRNPSGTFGSYPPDTRCKWTIKRPIFRGIEIKLIYLDLEPSFNCRYDYLFASKSSFTKTSQIPYETETEKRICEMVPDEYSKITSLSDEEINIYFVSDRSRQGKGFEIEYRLTCDSQEYISADSPPLMEVLKSPNYPDPYPPDINCKWVIQAESHRRLLIIPNDIDLRMSDKGKCDTDTVTVEGMVPVEGKGGIVYEDINGYRHITCKKSFDNITYTHGSVDVTFKSGPGLITDNRGFSLQINEIMDPCTDMHLMVDENHPLKVLHSPDFPNPSPKSLNCGWKISAPIGHRIKFNIDPETFNMEGKTGNACINDYLEIYDGPSKKNRLIGRYCGTSPPETIFSTSNGLFVHYKTDVVIPSNGFNATYSIADCGGTIFLKPNGKHTLTSPKYPHIDTVNHDCLWQLRAPKNYQILTKIKTILIQPNNNCSNGYVSIRDSYTIDDYTDYILPKVCINSPNIKSELQSKSNVIFVDYNITQVSSKANPLLCTTSGCGFSFVFTLVKQSCGGKITDDFGEMYSPGYPNLIIPGSTCEWIFKADLDHRYFFELEFLNEDNYNTPMISLDNYGPDKEYCYNDLKIYNGEPSDPNYYVGSDTMFCRNRNTFISVADVVTLKFEDKMKRQLSFSSLIRGRNISEFERYPFIIKYRKVDKNSFPYGCLYSITKESQISVGPMNAISNSNYSSGANSYCHINIKRPEGAYTTMISFSNFTVGPIYNRFCDFKNNYINIKPKPTDVVKWEHNLCSEYNFSRTSFVMAVALEEFDIFVYNNHKIANGTMVLGQENSQFNLSVNFAKCGGTIKAMKGTIASPYYSHANYNKSEKNYESCVWTLKAPEYHIIKIKILNMTLGDSSTGEVETFLNVFEGDSHDNALIHKFMHSDYVTKENDLEFKSKGQIIILQWYVGTFYREKSGFKLDYEFVRSDNECGYNTYGMNGTLISPGNDIYQNNLNCIWNINVPKGYLVKLTFRRFDLEHSDDCKNDFLIVSEIEDHNIEHRLTGFEVGQFRHHVFHKFCGHKKVPEPITSSSNGIRLNFTTDNQSGGKGFEIYWEAICGGVIEAASGLVVSPHFPLFYPAGIECNYIISANKIRGTNGHGGGLILSPHIFDISSEEIETQDTSVPHLYHNNRHQKCLSDYVEIFDVKTKRTLRKLCGKGYIEDKSKIYNQDDVGIKFVSNPTNIDKDEKGMKHYQGFAFKFIQNQCNVNVTLDDEDDTLHEKSLYELFSPNYPENYFPNLNCLVNITTKPGFVITAHIGFFEIEASSKCNFDYVEFFDGNIMNNQTSMGKLCGKYQSKRVIKSTGNNLLMKFKSDTSKNYKGYDITFTQSYGKEKNCGGKIIVGENPVTIKAPKYERNDKEYLVMDCVWELEAPKNQIIKITINELKLRTFKKGYLTGKCEDYLNIYDGIIDASPMIINNICNFNKYPDQTEIVLLSTNRIVNIELLAHYYNKDVKEMEIEVKAIDQECGGTLKANDISSIFAYQDKQLPTRNNQRHVRCKWYIFSEERTPLEISFTNFNVPALTLDCSEEYLEVRDVGSLVECQHPACAKTEEDKKVMKYCGTIKPSMFISLSPVVQITLSTFRTSQYQANVEFKYKTLGSCNRTITINEQENTLSGRFTSPNYPNNYLHNTTCITNFVLDKSLEYSHKIFLSFEDVFLERGSLFIHVPISLGFRKKGKFLRALNERPITRSSEYMRCKYDVLKIEDPFINMTKQYCGNIIPTPYLSTGPTLKLNLTTDHATSNRGYAGTYYAVRVVKTEDTTIYKFETNYDTEGSITNIGFPFANNYTIKSVWSIIPPRGTKCTLTIAYLKLPIEAEDPKCQQKTNAIFSIVHLDTESMNSNSTLAANGEMINVPCRIFGPQSYPLREGRKFYIHYEPIKVTNVTEADMEGFRVIWKCDNANFVSKGYHGIRTIKHHY
uniref:Cubilin n=1 Tax=Parastrongyloides trichosuri TaxID=131310 RepID=A0A0N5A6L6_PARTI